MIMVGRQPMPNIIRTNCITATTELSAQWAESITTDTFDGQAFLDRARELVAQYNAEEAA